MVHHNIDLYYQWKYLNINSFWVERGVFNAVALKGKNVLELSSGDGFNAKHFYSPLSESVIACDFDPTAIKHANKYNSSNNVKFVLADIRTSMPEGKFENIIWDAALEHFTEEEIESLMPNIKSRLTSDGILSGYTIVEKNHGHDGKMLHQHEYEFKNKEDLERFFKPHFKNINVFELLNSGQHNLYFGFLMKKFLLITIGNCRQGLIKINKKYLFKTNRKISDTNNLKEVFMIYCLIVNIKI